MTELQFIYCFRCKVFRLLMPIQELKGFSTAPFNRVMSCMKNQYHKSILVVVTAIVSDILAKKSFKQPIKTYFYTLAQL